MYIPSVLRVPDVSVAIVLLWVHCCMSGTVCVCTVPVPRCWRGPHSSATAVTYKIMSHDDIGRNEWNDWPLDPIYGTTHLAQHVHYCIFYIGIALYSYIKVKKFVYKSALLYIGIYLVKYSYINITKIIFIDTNFTYSNLRQLRAVHMSIDPIFNSELISLTPGLISHIFNI